MSASTQNPKTFYNHAPFDIKALYTIYILRTGFSHFKGSLRKNALEELWILVLRAVKALVPKRSV